MLPFQSPIWNSVYGFALLKQQHQRWYVLILTGIVFYVIACMVPWFGYVMKTVLTIHQCFSCCWARLARSQGLFHFSCFPASEEAEGTQEAGRGQNQNSWPKQIKMLFSTIWLLAQQKGNRRERRGICYGIYYLLWHLFSQENIYWEVVTAPSLLDFKKNLDNTVRNVTWFLSISVWRQEMDFIFLMGLFHLRMFFCFLIMCDEALLSWK